MRLKILDLFKRETNFDKHTGIIQNGDDNMYSERIERATNNSVTAKTACGIMSSYIIGNGFGDDLDTTIVNSKKVITLRKFLSLISKNIAKQRGVYVHVIYNANYKIDRFDVLPYTHCRKGKKDDNDYNGKILVYDKWDAQKIIKNDIKVFNVYNPNPSIIEAQVNDAKGWNNYKGQILYFNFDDEYEYALGTVDTVLSDCDSETQASIYKNRSLRKGFFGKTLIVTKPLSGSITDYASPEEWHKAENERDAFKKTAESFLGAENSGSLLHVELEHNEESLDNAIKVEQIASDINDQMFQYTEESVFKNILMAFNNIPTGLVRSDNALFAANGDSLQVMKETYQQNTEYERNSVEELVRFLMKSFKDDLGDLRIIPLIDVQEVQEVIPVTE
jgi:hypothetical protein